jgi:hypothetical protein
MSDDLASGSGNPNMRSCPTCDRDVSVFASTCPGCGHPFAGHVRQPGDDPSGYPPSGGVDPQPIASLYDPAKTAVLLKWFAGLQLVALILFSLMGCIDGAVAGYLAAAAISNSAQGAVPIGVAVIGTSVGAVIGLGLGFFLGRLATLYLEWSAQLLSAVDCIATRL